MKNGPRGQRLMKMVMLGDVLAAPLCTMISVPESGFHGGPGTDLL